MPPVGSVVSFIPISQLKGSHLGYDGILAVVGLLLRTKKVASKVVGLVLLLLFLKNLVEVHQAQLNQALLVLRKRGSSRWYDRARGGLLSVLLGVASS